jgi:ATP diphosphatase|tara:strand:- start:499 stop:876 length:378 start_codon:yes stop_codon:yes gene_type:complete
MPKSDQNALHNSHHNSHQLPRLIPKGMTPLLRAQKIQKTCSKVGFDWTELLPVVDKMHEEINEVLAEVNVSQPDQQAVEEEIGDLLFAVVNLARHTCVNAETALIKANRKFEKRFRQANDASTFS